MDALIRVCVVIRRRIYNIYITPREAAESDIPFQRFVDSVNTNAAVYNPAVAMIPNGIKIAEVAV